MRSGKFYRKNEKEVMESLGLIPTPGSGCGEVWKEDGQNDYVICQLKSTDANSIRVQQKDIRTLENNAAVSHKIPVFAVQFLNTNEVWLMVKPEDLPDVSEYINTGKTNKPTLPLVIEEEYNEETNVLSYVVKSSGNARKEYQEEQNRKYDKTRSAL